MSRAPRLPAEPVSNSEHETECAVAYRRTNAVAWRVSAKLFGAPVGVCGGFSSIHGEILISCT